MIIHRFVCSNDLQFEIFRNLQLLFYFFIFQVKSVKFYLLELSSGWQKIIIIICYSKKATVVGFSFQQYQIVYNYFLVSFSLSIFSPPAIWRGSTDFAERYAFCPLIITMLNATNSKKLFNWFVSFEMK